MSKELIVSTSPHELRVAITEEDQLVEIYIESESQHGLAGSIYKGRVTRVLPGMQSAFVNIGLSRDAFLYVSDFLEETEDVESSAAAADEAESKALAAKEAEDAARAVSSSPEQADGSGRSGTREERRGRRGRRGRRRRGRGDGFPEEKYADVRPEASEREIREELPEPEPEPPPAPEPVQRRPRPAPRSFAVLPGESLAKYSRSAAKEEFEAPGSASDEEDASRVGSGAGGMDEAFVASSANRYAEEDAVSNSGVAASSDGEEELEPFEPFTGSWHAADHRDQSRESHSGAVDASSPSETGDDENGSEESESSLAASPARHGIGAAGESRDAISADPYETSENAAEQSAEPGQLLEAAPESEDSQDGEGHRRVPGNPEPASEARLRAEDESSRFSRRRGKRGRRRRGRRREEGAGQPPATAREANPEEDESDPEPAEDRNAKAEVVSTNGDGVAAPGTSISDLLKKGQEILVQIAKEPLGRKGARITSHIALPGRFLVYMPTVDHVGVSRKIASDRERARLRRIVQTHRTGMPGGFIVRTAGEGASEEDVHGDMLFLYNLWLDIRQKAERKQSPALIHQDLDVVERVMRDQIGEDYKTIWVDGEDEYERTLRFVERFQPELVGRVKLYTRAKPIFDEFGITQDLERALRPKVWLKSGGYIVINPTEALVSIDVNTGKFVGKSDRLEDTIVKTNLEAAAEIVRQMRLRDLGGIIVVDFIDMDDRKNRQSVLRALEDAMRADRAPSKVLSFNEFGLLAITRKRVKQSLERALCTPCPYCSGSGYVKSPQTVVYEILAEAKKMSGSGERRKDVTLRVNPEVARLLKSKDNLYLQEVEDILHSNVLVRSDVGLNRENFDIN